VGKIHPVHSAQVSLAARPHHHDDDECPHYRDLVLSGRVAFGDGGYPHCEWCAAT